MTKLLKDGYVINVFTGGIEKQNVLIEEERIIGTGDYQEADEIYDVSGKYICPGFIDGHIHIESTMMTPAEFARAVLPHGTTAVVADPHEIANVCGMDGIQYMLKASEGIPVQVYLMLPSCVPSTPFDEAGARLCADELEPMYKQTRVLGLAEMMNYPAVIAKDREFLQKIQGARANRKVVDGHAPLLSGKELDAYLAVGIQSDHECSSFEEAKERIEKGQWVMIREGTAAKNLWALLPLFEQPWAHRCILVTDDRHPADLLSDGHIDNIIRKAVQNGKSAITAIQMATIQAAQYFGLPFQGAVAPGYRADILVLEDLESIQVRDVYCGGKQVVSEGLLVREESTKPQEQAVKAVESSFFLDPLTEKDFYIPREGALCRVIKTIPNSLLTEEWITEIGDDKNNGVDIERDIVKVSVIERHKNTGHRGLGYIHGMGLKRGAIAASVSHDSHNLVIIGTNDRDMAFAANRIITLKGGLIAVENGKVLAELPLPIAGLMSEKSAEILADENRRLLEEIYGLGVPEDKTPLMTMAFMSLTVIPSLKLTTHGLVDVNKQELVSLWVQADK